MEDSTIEWSDLDIDDFDSIEGAASASTSSSNRVTQLLQDADSESESSSHSQQPVEAFINDYADQRDFDTADSDTDYLRGQLQFILTELDEQPAPVWDFKSQEKLHTTDHFSEDTITTGPVADTLPTGDLDELEYFKLFFTDELLQQVNPSTMKIMSM